MIASASAWLIVRGNKFSHATLCLCAMRKEYAEKLTGYGKGVVVEMADRKVTPERRLELARCIREENLGNRLRLRRRESILYGREDLPLEEDGLFSSGNFSSGKNPLAAGGEEAHRGQPGTPGGSFSYRMALAVLLFVGFLICDTNGSRIFSYDANQVYEMIREDSLHLYDGGENAVMEQITRFFK